MTSPLQILYFIAISLAPSDAHHVSVTGGSEAYGWEKTDAKTAASTWVYDCAINPRQVLINNYIAPRDITSAQSSILRLSRHPNQKLPFVLVFDDAHQLQKNSGGYVYVVRPGAPNQKTYSFTFSK
jgi:hypothetical protein